MAQSPEQLRQALDELSLPEDDAENPLRLVRARVELLLEDNAGAAKDAGIFLNAATDATDPFYTATARAIRAIATENQGSVGEVVQDLMALETVTGDPKNKDAEVPTEPAWVASSLAGFLDGLPHPNPANGANQVYFSEWKQKLLLGDKASDETEGVSEERLLAPVPVVDPDAVSMIGVAASAPQDNPDLATKVHGFDSTMSSFDSGTLMRAVMEAGDLAAGEEAVVVVADEESEGTDKLVESEKSVESEPIIYPGEVSTLARAVAAESADVSALKHDLRRHLAGIESIGVSDAAKELDDAIPDEPAWSPPQPPAYRANQAKQAASAQLWTGPAKVYATKTVGEKISEETKTREQAAGEFVQAAKTYVRPVVVAPVKAAAPPPRVAAPYPKDMSGRGVAVNPATYKPPSPKSYQRPTVSTPPLSGRTYGTQTKLPLFSDPPGPLPAAVTASYGTWRPPTAVDAVEGIQKGQRLPGESIQPSVAAILQSDTGKFGIDWTVKFAFLPRANDELPLALGDRVWVYRVMRDGFAYGRNINAGLEGWFPVGCLARKM